MVKVVTVAVAMAVVLVAVFASGSNGQSSECLDTFNQGCQDLNTIHGQQQCCSMVRSLYTNNLQCLCQIFTATEMTKVEAISYLSICDLKLTGPFPCAEGSPMPPTLLSPPPPFRHPQAPPPPSPPLPRQPSPRTSFKTPQDSGFAQAKENTFLGSFRLTGLYLLWWFAIA